MRFNLFVNRRPVDLDVACCREFGLGPLAFALALGGFALPALDPVIFGRWDWASRKVAHALVQTSDDWLVRWPLPEG